MHECVAGSCGTVMQKYFFKQGSCVTASHEKSTTTCTYSDMKESFDGLVVSSATVSHGYCIHATLPQVRVLVLHQAFN